MTRTRLAETFCLIAIACFCGCAGEDRAATQTGAPASAATRVVTLSPHLAELAYAAGAGESLVGVSSYTDYPEAAAALPRVGDAFLVDQERLAMLQPDLLLAWDSGTPDHVVELLRASGYRVESIRTRSLDDVARALEIVGSLTGHASEGDAAAAAFRKSLAELASRHRESPPIRVFYQVSRQPLYTVNGEHFVSELLALCGGTNIFSDLTELAPLVSPEAVLDRNPEVVLAAGDVDDGAFDEWKRWTELAASRYDNFFLLPAAEIGRPATRLVMAGHAACAALDDARKRRAEVSGG